MGFWLIARTDFVPSALLSLKARQYSKYNPDPCVYKANKPLYFSFKKFSLLSKIAIAVAINKPKLICFYNKQIARF